MHFSFFARLLTVGFIVATLVSMVSPFIPDTSAKRESEMVLEEKARSYSYLGSIQKCMEYSMAYNDQDGGEPPSGDRFILPSSAERGDWFAKDSTVVVSYLASAQLLAGEGDGNQMYCNSVVKLASDLWGYTSPLHMLCDFYNKDDGGKRMDGSDCLNSRSDANDNIFLGLGVTAAGSYDDVENFAAAIIKKVYSGISPNNTSGGDATRTYNAIKYLFFTGAFLGSETSPNCRAQKGLTGDDDRYTYKNVLVTEQRTVHNTTNDALPNAPISSTSTEWTNVRSDYNGIDKTSPRDVYVDITKDQYTLQRKDITLTCAQIAQQVSDLAPYFLAYKEKYPDEELSKEEQCTLDGTCETAIENSTCIVGGVGWIVCSVTTFLAEVADNIYGLIEGMLKVPVINSDTGDTSNGVYSAWEIMRSLANIAFVIAFLIIIFSQLTSVGVSNYGVKKALPRLVIAAILVNVSFWVSAIAVDISNILGAGIYDVLSGVKERMNIDVVDSGGNWVDIMSALMSGAGIALAGGTVVAAGVALAFVSEFGMALLYMAMPIVLSAVLAVLITIFTLIARQALIVILIIVSPLAFVALLLPNTENLFKKWRQMLMSLLLMYPIVSVIFGGAQIAGFAVLSTITAGDDGLAVGIKILTAQLLMIVPFFFLPTIIMKFSGGNLDRIAASLNSKGKSLVGNLSKRSRQAGMERFNRGVARARYGPKRGGIRGGISELVGQTRRMDQKKAQKGMIDARLKDLQEDAVTERLGTDKKYATKAAAGDVKAGERLSSQALTKARNEELKKSLEPLQDELAGVAQGKPTGKFLFDRAQDMSRTAAERRAAAHQLAVFGDSAYLDKLLNHSDEGVRESARLSIVGNATGPLSTKAPDFIKGEDVAFGSVKASELAGFSKDTMERYVKYLAKLKAEGRTEEYKAAVGALETSLTNIQANPNFDIKNDAAASLAEAAKTLPEVSGIVSSRITEGGAVIRPTTPPSAGGGPTSPGAGDAGIGIQHEP